MLKYRHPWLAVWVHYWPALIMLPTILLLIAVLATITHWWDASDRAGSQRGQGRSGDVPAPGD